MADMLLKILVLLGVLGILASPPLLLLGRPVIRKAVLYVLAVLAAAALLLSGRQGLSIAASCFLCVFIIPPLFLGLEIDSIPLLSVLFLGAPVGLTALLLMFGGPVARKTALCVWSVLSIILLLFWIWFLFFFDITQIFYYDVLSEIPGLGGL